ncbi:MAG: response regulator, partial [Magnetospirillum sp.]|nr:response regulator [Magnetospirillum sp.]
WSTIYQGCVNVLFLDWSGDVDAVDFLHELRNPGNPERFVPVVVMTDYCGAEHVAQMRDVGANEFMLRPLSQDVVASRLRSIVGAPRLFIQDGNFFGPDRRRRRVDLHGSERRNHENWRSGDRRRTTGAQWSGPERRQGRSGFEPLERRTAQRA